jgi:hypothetical protein
MLAITALQFLYKEEGGLFDSLFSKVFIRIFQKSKVKIRLNEII